MTVEIAIIGAQRPQVLKALEEKFVCHKVWDAPDKVAALKPVAERIRGVASHGMAGLSRELLAALPNLEIVALNGVGLETTDVAGCKERGVTVTITPVLYEDVADLAIVLAMSAFRRIPQNDRFVRAGSWLKGRAELASKFSGKRAGILGLGRIGMEVGRRLEGFRMQIAYADLKKRDDVPYEFLPSAVALAERSDVLFLCAAGGQGGKHIVDAQVIEALGPKGVFVNIARGWLVDEPALVKALKEGKLGGAGLDVFEREPTVPTELWELDNVVLTPHIASGTVETMGAMGECMVGNLVSHFAGKGAVTPAF
jgi:lactate dehydrogenase-like 2-hydroxyacid dehydrogenase